MPVVGVGEDGDGSPACDWTYEIVVERVANRLDLPGPGNCGELSEDLELESLGPEVVDRAAVLVSAFGEQLLVRCV